MSQRKPSTAKQDLINLAVGLAFGGRMARHWFFIRAAIKLHSTLIKMVFPILYYGTEISKHRVTYATPVDPPIRVVRPLWHRAFDWLSFMLGICSMIALGTDDRVHRVLFMRIFFGLVPPIDREHMLITLSIWTGMRILYHFWPLRYRRVQRYAFLAVLRVRNLHDDKSLEPKDLDITLEQYTKIRRFQKIGFTLVYPFVVYLMWSGMVSRFKSLIYMRAWDLSPILTTFWIMAYVAWSCTMASFFYGFPVMVSVVTYYLWLKLNSIKQDLDQLNEAIDSNGSPDLENPTILDWISCFRVLTQRRFYRINHRYNEIYREMTSYNTVIGPSLTLVVAGFTASITYCSYITFLTRIPAVLIAAFRFILFTHSFSLIMIIMVCNWVADSHRRVGSRMVRFCKISTQTGLFSYRQMIKFDTMTEGVIRRKIGFYLLNGEMVRSTLFFTILFYVSTLFFLLINPKNAKQST